jgi:hypothetical protein
LHDANIQAGCCQEKRTVQPSLVHSSQWHEISVLVVQNLSRTNRQSGRAIRPSGGFGHLDAWLGRCC